MAPSLHRDYPILGLAGSSPLGPRTMICDSQAHGCTIALPGAGKTQSVAIPNLIRRQCSACFLDFVDGQITKAVMLYRQHVLGQECSVLDPLHVVPAESMPTIDGKPAYATINPIGLIARSNSPIVAAKGIAEAMIIPDERQAHWGEAAQGLFAGVSIYIATAPDIKDGDRNLRHVWDILTDRQFFKQAMRSMSVSDNVYVRDIANAYIERKKSSEELAAIRNCLRTQCGAIFGDTILMDSMCGDTVSFRDLNKRRITVSAVLPGVAAYTMKRYLRLFMSVVLSEMEAAGLRRFDSFQPPTLFQADEFATLGHFPQFVDAMARGRNFGFQAHIFLQSYSQLERNYGNAWREVMGHMGFVQCFGGTADELTANEISRLSGEGTIIAPSVSYSHGGKEGSSESYGFTKRRVYTPDEVMRLKPPKQLVSYTGKGMAEGTLFQYGMKDFPDYLYFMDLLKQGVAPEEAGRRTRFYQEAMNRDFDARMAKMYADQSKASSTATQRKPPMNIGRMLNRGLAGLFGDDTDF